MHMIYIYIYIYMHVILYTHMYTQWPYRFWPFRVSAE